MDKSRILSQKTVFQSKFFRVDQVDLDFNGKKITKDIIRRNPSVFILAINDKQEIYLVQQYRDALRDFSLEVIAGTADESEDVFETAKRELKEEAGLTAKKWKKLTTLNTSANMDSYAHIFLAEELEEGAASPDEDEELEVVKMPLQEAVEKIMHGRITNSPSVAGILMLDKMYYEGR